MFEFLTPIIRNWKQIPLDTKMEFTVPAGKDSAGLVRTISFTLVHNSWHYGLLLTAYDGGMVEFDTLKSLLAFNSWQ